jgi:hypothetical protein
MEIHDQVLKTLVDADKPRGNFFSLKPIMERQYPAFSQAKIAKILAHLEADGFLQTSTRKTKSVPHFVKLTSAAYTHFKEKEARTSMLIERARARAEERVEVEVEEPKHDSGNIGAVMIAYAVGLISGIFLMWIRVF